MTFHWKRKELLNYLQLLFSSNKQRLESKEELDRQKRTKACSGVVVCGGGGWEGGGAWRGGSGRRTVHTLWYRGFDSCCSNATGVADVSNKCCRKVTPRRLGPDRGRSRAIHPTDPQWSGVWPTFSPLHTHTRTHTHHTYSTLEYPLRLQPFRPPTWLWLPVARHPGAHLSPAHCVDASPKQTEQEVDIIDSLRGRFFGESLVSSLPTLYVSRERFPFFVQFITNDREFIHLNIESGSVFYVVSYSRWHIMIFEWVIVVQTSKFLCFMTINKQCICQRQ